MGPINENFLWASLLWGSIGSGMFLFGWRQKSALPLVCGLLMTLVSYFAEGALSMSVISIALIALMIWVGRRNG